MASFTKLASGSWRVQVRHKGRYVSESFQRREDAALGPPGSRTKMLTIRDRKDPREKKGNDQRIPLLAVSGYDAMALIEEQRAIRGNEDDRIFPCNHKSVTRACRMLRIEDPHFHDLRHEGTSRLFEAGFRIEQVSLVTGHKDWKMLRRYTHLKPESLHYFAPRAA